MQGFKLAAISVVLSLLVPTAQVEARNNTGAVVGGLVLGAVIASALNHRDRSDYSYDRSDYTYDRSAYYNQGNYATYPGYYGRGYVDYTPVYGPSSYSDQPVYVDTERSHRRYYRRLSY